MSLIRAKWSFSSARQKIRCFFMLFLLGTTKLCFALPDDRLQTMQLRANSADLDQHAHRGVYIGDVQLDQGTTHVRAAKAITEGNEKNQLVKAVIEGNKNAQAHYWTTAADDKPPLHAYADIIYYYPERHLIELIGHARVEQGEDSFAAPKISYDIQHQHVVSSSNEAERTLIVIHSDAISSDITQKKLSQSPHGGEKPWVN